jgi:hypothetical protein
MAIGVAFPPAAPVAEPVGEGMFSAGEGVDLTKSTVEVVTDIKDGRNKDGI